MKTQDDKKKYIYIHIHIKKNMVPVLPYEVSGQLQLVNSFQNTRHKLNSTREIQEGKGTTLDCSNLCVLLGLQSLIKSYQCDMTWGWSSSSTMVSTKA